MNNNTINSAPINNAPQSLFQTMIGNPLKRFLGISAQPTPSPESSQPTPSAEVLQSVEDIMQKMAADAAEKQQKIEQPSLVTQENPQKSVSPEHQIVLPEKTQVTPKQSFLDNLEQLWKKNQEVTPQNNNPHQNPLNYPVVPPTMPQGLIQNNPMASAYNAPQMPQSPYGQTECFPAPFFPNVAAVPLRNFLATPNNQFMGGGGLSMLNNNFAGGYGGGNNLILPNFYQGFFSAPSNLFPLNFGEQNGLGGNALGLGGIGGIGGIGAFGGLGGIGALGAFGGLGDLSFGGLGAFPPPIYF